MTINRICLSSSESRDRKEKAYGLTILKLLNFVLPYNSDPHTVGAITFDGLLLSVLFYGFDNVKWRVSFSETTQC